MRISEVMPHGNGDRRRVGIQFPTRQAAFTAACKLYRERSIDVEIIDTDIWLEVPQLEAAWMMGALERLTGTPGFNDWDDYGAVTR